MHLGCTGRQKNKQYHVLGKYRIHYKNTESREAPKSSQLCLGYRETLGVKRLAFSYCLDDMGHDVKDHSEPRESREEESGITDKLDAMGALV